MELLQQFGINPLLLGAQIINFLIVLFILKKFLYKPILETLEKRKEAIKRGIAQSEEAAALLEKTQEKERKILRDAQTKAKTILDAAKKESEEIIENANDTARKNTEKMITQAKETIEDEIKKTELKLAAKTSKLAIEYLEKALSGFFTQREQEEILKKVEKKMKGN